MPDNVRPGIYRHYKGNLYEVYGVATHSETGQELVVYRALYGAYRLTVRPKDLFTQDLDMPAYHHRGPRFVLIQEF